MTLSLELLEEHRMFGGWQQRYRHAAQSLNCNMTFSIRRRRAMTTRRRCCTGCRG